MRAIVATTQPRTGLVREMRGEGIKRKADGAVPVRNVSRHAARSDASSCQRDGSMLNLASTLKIDRP